MALDQAIAERIKKVRATLPEAVLVRELGPREGFQVEKRLVSTEEKVQFINALSETGLRHIEVTSFVHPKWVPTLADAEEVLERIERRPGVTYAVLILNEKGIDRAISSGRVDRVSTTIFASEAMNRRNNNRTIAESLREVERILRKAEAAKIRVEGGISTAFGCPIQGDVPVEQVLELAQQWIGWGVKEILLGDTTGEANPVQVRSLLSLLFEKFPDTTFIPHLHDTRGMGLASALAALEAGATVLDGSVGGLGGCPYAPGAAGNLVTEDLVGMLHEMGIETGIELEQLIECAKIAEALVGRKLPGRLKEMGPVKHCP